MKHQDGYLKGVRDTNIYYQYWLPEKDPKAILLIAHGLAEHSGRYMNLVNHLVPSGYAVYGIDHIGHGKSDGKRAYVERFQDYTETLKNYFDMIQEWQPNKSIFLIGHSMGGLISAAYLLNHQDETSGAVLSGPSIKVPDNISKAVIFVGKMLSIIIPGAGLVRLDSDGLSRDSSVVEAYVNDPLVYTGKATARLGAELIKAMQNVTLQAANINLPIMIAQGSDDKLVDPGGAQLLYDLIGSKDKTIKIYNGLYHEIFNEPEHEQVLNDVTTWIDSHLGDV
ncbi:MAG: alpha/beta hydrolase [Desulfobacula sp.]|jgi:alpha-beta hydrolase superfamily lysophospholipase|uniref:alpha/beta hydrolase n=1 Tax=Desulfobacula sp. TaxID=2593537 RepID=UPI001E15787A|nr:alpha/beta hydrolase [Desulfobacula sp.]MBT3487595.1 alpha/beta hydrolase [Desulfobacula sp.]MBT3807016.1 alpha/beta hydrolase [Desulfobacula sp.]MBT4023651.1 alpha/beta hydrolase [Desulfobacula sp.]MBT4199892.1 alpha/beta hydrolase [Desulfobacula sp.]